MNILKKLRLRGRERGEMRLRNIVLLLLCSFQLSCGNSEQEEASELKSPFFSGSPRIDSFRFQFQDSSYFLNIRYSLPTTFT